MLALDGAVAAWQLSHPCSQGRLMAGQAPLPHQVLVIGRGGQDEKEKESKGRHDHRWSSGRCDMEDRGQGCACTEHIQKQQLLRARQLCLHSWWCTSSPGTVTAAAKVGCEVAE